MWKNTALVVFCLLVLIGPQLRSQTSNGDLTGTVSDVSGANIPGVTIRVKNIATDVSIETTSSSGGLYNVTSLIPGSYNIECEKQGFEKTLVQQVAVQASQTTTVDIKMRVGATSSTVDVRAQTDLLTPGSPEVATTIENELVSNLPYAERSSLGAAILAAGVRGDPSSPNQMMSENPGIATGAIAPASILSVGGAFPGRTSILIDGSDVTQSSYPRTGISVSADMVQETTVISSGLPAQYGRSEGGVIIQATRSGGGGYHGGVTWRHSDPFFQSQQLGSPLPPLAHTNFFGGYIGGPVWIPKVYNGRNKTFFYVGVEPGRLNNATSAQGTVPTAAELSGQFYNSLSFLNTTILRASGVEAAMAAPRVGGLYYQYPLNSAGFPAGAQYSNSGLYVPVPNDDLSAQVAQNKFAQFLAARLPTPANPGPYVSFLRPDGLWLPNGNNVNYQRGVFNVDNRYSARVDHVISANDRMFVRYSGEPLNSTRYFALAANNPLTQVPGDIADSLDFAMNEVHIFSPSLVNEARIMYMRDRQFRSEDSAALSQNWAATLGLTPATSGVGFPNTNLGYTTQIGNSGESSQVDENYQFEDDVTWTRGKHTIRFGFDLRRLQSNQYNLGGTYGGIYGFGTGATNNGVTGGNSLATLDLGLITSFSNTPDPVPAYYRFHYVAGYAQDDWKWRSNITVNVGLRYEVETPRIEKYNSQGTFIPGVTGTLNGQPAQGGFCFSGSCGLPTSLWPTNYMGFEPRLGIAWVPRPFMTVRAAYDVLRAPLTGYGITPVPDFNVPSTTVGGTTGGIHPGQGVDFISNPIAPLTSALSALQGHGPFFTVQGLTVPFVTQNNVVPYTQQWSFTLQFQLEPHTLLQVSYHGLRGTHLISRFAPPQNYPSIATLEGLVASNYNFSSNIPNPYGITSGASVITENKLTALVPYQNFFNQSLAEIYNRAGNSIYNALYISATHRFSNGLSFVSNFVWSKSIDNIGGDANTGNNGVTGATQVQNPQDINLDRSVSNFDVPLSFTTGFTYILPIGQGKWLSTHNRVVDLLVGGWVTSGIFNRQSGQPFWVALGSSGYWFSQTGTNSVAGALPSGINLRPDVVAGQSCIDPNWRNDPINTPYINASYFSIPGSLGHPAFGDAPATLTNCRSPRITTFDANVHKKIPLGHNEKRYLEIGLNAINAFNHPAFFLNLNTGHSLYNAFNTAALTSPGTPPFTVQSSFGFLGISNTSPRLVQASLKLFF
jgi:Carboxypeptidase regulatory-like domain